MNLTLKAELAKISQLSQRQDSGLEQLRDLHTFANRLGLYDAADLIKELTKNLPRTDPELSEIPTNSPLSGKSPRP